MFGQYKSRKSWVNEAMLKASRLGVITVLTSGSRWNQFRNSRSSNRRASCRRFSGAVCRLLFSLRLDTSQSPSSDESVTTKFWDKYLMNWQTQALKLTYLDCLRVFLFFCFLIRLHGWNQLASFTPHVDRTALSFFENFVEWAPTASTTIDRVWHFTGFKGQLDLLYVGKPSHRVIYVERFHCGSNQITNAKS
jgi:hypothetical protein